MKFINSRMPRIVSLPFVLFAAWGLATTTLACSSGDDAPADTLEPRSDFDATPEDESEPEALYDAGPSKSDQSGGDCEPSAIASALPTLLMSAAGAGAPKRCTPGTNSCGILECCLDPAGIAKGGAPGLPSLPVPGAGGGAPKLPVPGAPALPIPGAGGGATGAAGAAGGICLPIPARK